VRYKDQNKKMEIVEYVNDFYREYHSTPTVREIARHVSLGKSAVYNYLSEMRDEGMIDYDGRVITTEKISDRLLNMNTAVIVGNVCCGLLTPETEEQGEYVDLPVSIFGNEKLYLLRAYGDSMTGAGIYEGDLLAVDPNLEARDGDLVVALTEDGTTVKRLRMDPKHKRVILHPENPKYGDIPLDECRVQGVVRSVIRVYK